MGEVPRCPYTEFTDSWCYGAIYMHVSPAYKSVFGQFILLGISNIARNKNLKGSNH